MGTMIKKIFLSFILLVALSTPAFATVGVETGSFTLNTSTGIQTVTLVTSETPQVIILTTLRQTAFNSEATSGDSFFIVGAGTSSTNRFSVSDFLDNAKFGDYGHAIHDDHILMVYVATSNTIAVDLDSLDAGSFDLDIVTTDATAIVVGYVAIWGLSAVTVGTCNTPTSTGNSDCTTTGVNPDVVFTYNAIKAGESLNTFYGTNGLIGFGVLAGSTEEWTASHYALDNPTNGTAATFQSSSASLSQLNNTTVLHLADCTSLGTAKFTLNHSTVQASAMPFAFVAMEGVDVDTGAAFAYNSTGSEDITTSVDPIALFTTNQNLTTEDTATGSSQAIDYGFGTSSTSRFNFMMSERNGCGGCTSERRLSGSTSVLRNRDVFGNEKYRADIASLGTAKFTLDWEDAGSGTEYYYWAVLANPTGGGGGSSVKTVDGLAKASVKTSNELANASVKTWQGLA